MTRLKSRIGLSGRVLAGAVGVLVVLGVSATASNASTVSRSMSAAAAAAACPLDDVCVWTGTDFTGTMRDYAYENPSEAGGFFPVGAVQSSMESVMNKTPYRYWMKQFQTSGNEVCINPSPGENENVGSANDHDYWGQFTTNTSAC